MTRARLTQWCGYCLHFAIQDDEARQRECEKCCYNDIMMRTDHCGFKTHPIPWQELEDEV